MRSILLAAAVAFTAAAFVPPASAACDGEPGVVEVCRLHAEEGDCAAGVARASSGAWVQSSGARAGVYSDEICYDRADGSRYHSYVLFVAVEADAVGLYWWPAHYQYTSAGQTECRVGVDSLDAPADCERTPREHPGALLP